MNKRSLLWYLPLAWSLLFLSLLLLSLIWPQGAGVSGFVLSFLGLSVLSLSGALTASWATPKRGVIISSLFLALPLSLLPGLLGVSEIWGAFLAGLGLITAMTWLGVGIGRGVQEASHLWPLVIVALSADIWSVTDPSGVTQQLILDEQAPSLFSALLLLQLPVPGLELSPILGLGDLIFTGLLYGAIATLQLSWRRLSLGLLLGYLLCLLTLLALQIPLPALPFLGLAGVLALGRSAPVRFKELGLAFLFLGGLLSLNLFL